MAVTVITKHSTTNYLTPSGLVKGELAINVADGSLWYGDSAAAPKHLATSLRLQPTAPSTSLPAGTQWYETDTDTLHINTGGQWKTAMPLQDAVDDLTALIDSKIDDLREEIQAYWPIGSVLYTENTDNPATFMGFGTWSRIAQGRFIAGEGTGTDINGIQETGVIGNNDGYYENKLTLSNIPSHTHKYVVDSKISNGTNPPSNGHAVGDTGNAEHANEYTTSATGSSNPTPISNIPPAYGLYVWKRTG